MKPHGPCITAILAVLLPLSSSSQLKLLDDFEALSGWNPIVSEGAKVNIISGEGKSGKGMLMEFDLLGVYGYVIAEKEFVLDLPSNYQFTFDMKAEAPVNNFEFKLIDEKENVYWIKKLNVQYPKAWEKQRIKKRHLSFAWGPSPTTVLRTVRKIQFVVSSGTGGKGKVYFDNFRFEPIDDSAAEKTRAHVAASSMTPAGEATLDAQGVVLSNWRSAGGQSEWISIDFKYPKEIGGLVIDWEKGMHATAYDVLLSDDGKEWTTGYSVRNGTGERDYVYLPEQEGRIIKVVCLKSVMGRAYGIERLEVKGPAFSSHPNDFFSNIAADFPKGYYPKYYLKQQTYWTVIGTSGDDKESLINEQGIIEVDKLSFSLEPFLFVSNKLVTWNDASPSQSLLEGYLPIPSVLWSYGGWELTIYAFSAGVPGNSMLIVTYHIENRGSSTRNGSLFIALRPFQVNPPWQWLNTVGGASRIDSVRNRGGILHIGQKEVIPLEAPRAFGATAFETGEIVEYLRKGTVPSADSVIDRDGFASAALHYDFDIPWGEALDFHVVVPYHGWRGSPTPHMGRANARAYTRLALASTIQLWKAKLNTVQLQLPASAQPIVNTIRSNLAYIFINRDGPGIQPGSRSYERSWIRDGSLTSTALLQMGYTEEVRDFLDWYAKFQFPSGKIPCVVDTRGGDPTNEHDSHGQFIYAVLSYFHYTRDTTWLRGKFENVVKAVRYIQSLRAQRKTDTYLHGTPEQRALYGLVPESISHEGYWDVPRHSYWDGFFVLRGLKDAATMAGILGEKQLEKEFSVERDDFRKDLYASMRLAMKNTKVDYIPGCAELGDFDATSTTIGIHPGGELGLIPEPELHNTFEKYYTFFREREKDQKDWVNYTPYETRVIGSFVYLDQKDRAHEALNYFMKDRRPAAWNHWAEVVWRDSSAPKYIGDMPHTWVGSDFIRSVRAMFVYERESDGALVVGAGIPEAWVTDSVGMRVSDLPTWYGTIGYSMVKQGNTIVADLAGDARLTKAKIVLRSPMTMKLRAVTINGKKTALASSGEVVVRGLPAKVVFSY